MVIHKATLDIAFGEHIPNVACTFSKDSVEIINSDVDSECEEYQPTTAKNKVQKAQNIKKLNQDYSISKPIELEPHDEDPHFMILQKSLQFFRYFGYMLGIDISYAWKPNRKYYVTLFLLVLIWSQIFYTQFLHIKNNEYYKLLELFACYGITISVINFLNLIHVLVKNYT